MAEIYAAISSAMARIGAIGKGQRNSAQGYNFRGIDDVMNALYPVMVEHHLFLVPEMIDKQVETRTGGNGKPQVHALLTMRYTMYAQDGSSVSAVTLGEGLDSGDKACNKAMAVAMKYAMFQLFCIPTEEMRLADPDNYSPEIVDAVVMCEDCGQPITAHELNGKMYDKQFIINSAQTRYKKCLCWDCLVERKSKQNG